MDRSITADATFSQSALSALGRLRVVAPEQP